MEYNLLFRWFVGLGIDDAVWVATVFTKNRDRLLSTEMSRNVMAAILAHREVAPLLSDDHFSVDGTLVKAWASMKSFEPKADDTPPDDDPGSPPGPDTAIEEPDQPTEPDTAPMPRDRHQNRNAEVDFRGEKRSNAAHASTTDPDARLYKKSPGTGAMLCFIGHVLMENRNGLIVQGDLTQADGHAERRAALDMIHRHSPVSTRRLTLGADKGFDAAEFVADLRQACVTPHVAQKSRYSAIDGRTTRHEGYALSIKHRKRIEEAFGWAKTVGGMARPSIAASNGCVPASSSPWPPTTSPDRPACSQPDAGKPRQGCRSPASMAPKTNPAGCAEVKLFRDGDFFSTLLILVLPFDPHNRRRFERGYPVVSR